MQAAANGSYNTPQPKSIRVMPIMISLLISGFIGLFSETALNIAIHELTGYFDISKATAQWLTTGYLLTLGVLVPFSGVLLQWFTTRQLFIASLAFSIVGTVIAAMAPSFAILMTARVLQAAGTGLLLPLMFNTILIVFPVEKRGAAMGVIGLVIMFAPAIGPTAAGLLIDKLDWHWIFWLSLPFLILALICGLLFMQNVTTPTRPRIDVLSILLSTIGFGGIVFGFSSAGEGGGGWSSPLVVAPMAVGFVALLFFTLRQLRMEQPMINMRVFRYPMFVLGLAMVLFCMMIILSSMLILPLYLQGAMMLSALAAGLMLLPGGLMNGLLSPVMGRLFDRFGPRGLVIPGLVIVSIAMWQLSGITPETPIAFIIVMHSAIMVGISMVWMPSQTNGLNQLPPELYPDGTAVMNTLQQVAGAIGTAVAVSILSNGIARQLAGASDIADPAVLLQANTVGTQQALLFSLAVTVAGLILALFIRRVVVDGSTRQAPSH
ncbi:MFS transporter [Paenibacillus sp. 598K]|uniref:DHA2 family efflux MFS transporter permease subunit n=1 Tax=Paenibacillus sp. 598K TaxID=1117987 RepID=UPI000FF98123|nr:DHA2 family efflux MFS transporter permease subunit [Paenibacillus sp. 598K]GBF76663.1 MFS transporter [Paenibacillus sp. 598K]